VLDLKADCRVKWVYDKFGHWSVGLVEVECFI
jgi:hypothetical protein